MTTSQSSCYGYSHLFLPVLIIAGSYIVYSLVKDITSITKKAKEINELAAGVHEPQVAAKDIHRKEILGSALQALIEKTIKDFEDENQCLVTYMELNETGQKPDLSTAYDFECALTDMKD